MPRRALQKTVLVASRDPRLMDVRKHVLEDAGYRVILASNIHEVSDACQGKIDLVLIGYSLRTTGKMPGVGCRS
jgi:CheY-like chemotaxis protein